MSVTDACELPADRRRGSTFGWSLGMVLRRWHEYVEELLSDLPHRSRGYHILAVVVHEEVPTQGALAARLAIDRSVLTYVIDDLENAGLIERKLDPQDRRARRVVATERGRETLAEAERRVAHAEDHVLGGLPEDQRRRLPRLRRPRRRGDPRRRARHGPLRRRAERPSGDRAVRRVGRRAARRGRRPRHHPRRARLWIGDEPHPSEGVRSPAGGGRPRAGPARIDA